MTVLASTAAFVRAEVRSTFYTSAAGAAPDPTTYYLITSQTGNGYSTPATTYTLPGSASTDVIAGFGAAADQKVHLTFTGLNINLSRMSLLYSAQLRIQVTALGSAVTPSRIYAKFKNQSVLPVTTIETADTWIAAGKLTQAYVTWTPAVGVNNVDVSDLLCECMGSDLADGWSGTNQTIQFIVVPQGTQTSTALHGITIQRFDGSVYKTRLGIYAYQVAQNGEKPALASGRVMAFEPFTPADIANPNAIRIINRNSSDVLIDRPFIADYLAIPGNFYNGPGITPYTGVATNFPELGTTENSYFDDRIPSIVWYGEPEGNLHITWRGGWRMRFGTRDYLFLGAFQRKLGGGEVDRWDWYQDAGWGTYASDNHTSGYLEDTSGRPSNPAIRLAPLPAYQAGQAILIARYYDHTTTRWHYKAQIIGPSATTVEGVTPAQPFTAANNVQHYGGFGYWLHINSYDIFGQAMIEIASFTNNRDVWLDYGLNTMRLWTKGLKIFDPRMVTG